MARPTLEINAEQVQKLAAIGCTNAEIADFFDCDPKTISNRFSIELKLGRAEGKQRLRMMQWKSAERGSVQMQTWLGKQHLGQADKVEQKVEHAGHIESDAERAERVAMLLQTAQSRRNEDDDLVPAEDSN